MVGLLVPLLWVSFGEVAGVAAALLLAAFLFSFVPRALILDEEGFRLVSPAPRKKVLWSNVESFNESHTLRGNYFVRYTRAGRTPRWWYPAGWPAQGGIPAAFALAAGDKALRPAELADVLNKRLARGRAP